MDMNENREMKEFGEMMDRIIAEDLKASFDYTVSSSVMTQIRGHQPFRISLYRKVMQVSAVAACLLIAVLLGIYLGRIYTGNVYVSSAEASQDEITADDARLERLNIINP